MIPLSLVAMMLLVMLLGGCREDVSFQLDRITEVKVERGTTYKEVVGEKYIENNFSVCHLRVYAVNYLDYGIKVGPKITVNIHGVEHIFSIDSWGDDWEYLVAGKKGEEYKQKLCFKNEALNPMSCAELADAIKNKAYKLELNRCEKIDQSATSCNVGVSVVQGGINFRAITTDEVDIILLAD